MEILVARQPVFDKRESIFGYDLLLRRPGQAGATHDKPDELFVNAILGVGLDRLVGNARAFVAVDRDMLADGSVELLPPSSVIAQLVGDVAQDESMADACEELLWKGYRVALAPNDPLAVPDRLLRAAEMVKLDVSTLPVEYLQEVAPWLRSYQIRLLATHARHRAERDLCIKLGFELFQGYRFSAPETLSGQDLAVQHVLTFRVLRLVRDPWASDAEIEELIRRDVGLPYKLLRIVNSAAFGGRGIWSIGHALRLLGREQVARWLSLLLVVEGANGGVRSELMELALTRGRLCELLATASGIPRAAGALFLVGLLSPLDQLLETPMETLVSQMELAPDVRDALLYRADFYGSVLALIESYEAGQWDAVDAHAEAVGVAPEVVARLYLEALEWASDQGTPAEPASLTVKTPTPPRPTRITSSSRLAHA